MAVRVPPAARATPKPFSGFSYPSESEAIPQEAERFGPMLPVRFVQDASYPLLLDAAGVPNRFFYLSIRPAPSAPSEYQTFAPFAIHCPSDPVRTGSKPHRSLRRVPYVLPGE